MADADNIINTGSPKIQMDSDGTAGGSDKLTIITGSGAGTELMRIQEDGKVGIGKTDPSHKLHLYTGSSVKQTFALFHTNDGTTNHYLHIGVDFSETTAHAGIYNAAKIIAQGVPLLIHQQDFGQPIIFGCHTTELMRIEGSAGYVGIGTSSPNAKLTVEGTISLDEISAPSATAGYGKIYVKSDDHLLFFIDQSGNSYDLTAGAGNEKAKVSADDTTPGYLNGKLTAGTGITLTEQSGGANETLQISIGQAVGTANTPTFAGLTIDTNTIYVDTANHRLGIGTASPGVKLDVFGAIRSSASSGGTALSLYSTTNSAEEWKQYLNGEDLRFADDSDDRITFKKGGNVGIGTTSPGEKLEINGKLKMGDNIVLNGHWLSGDGGNEGIYVDNSGNVGIGTASPGYGVLDIVSPYAKTDTTARNVLRLRTNDASVPFDLKIAVIGAAAVANRIFTFQTGDHTDTNEGILSLQSYGGKVGIGTTNPGNLLSMEASGGGYYSTADHDWHVGACLKDIKNDIQELNVPNILGTLKDLKIKKFQYKDFVDDKYVKPDKNKSYSAGFISEDVPKELRLFIPEDGTAGIRSLFSYLVMVCQEQQKRIESLESKLSKGK